MSLNSDAQRRSSVEPHPFRWGRGGVRSSLLVMHPGDPANPAVASPANHLGRSISRTPPPEGYADLGLQIAALMFHVEQTTPSTAATQPDRAPSGGFTWNNRLVFHDCCFTWNRRRTLAKFARHPATFPSRRTRGSVNDNRVGPSPTESSRPRLLDATSRQLHPNESRFLNHHSDETSGCGWVGETTT